MKAYILLEPSSLLYKQAFQTILYVYVRTQRFRPVLCMFDWLIDCISEDNFSHRIGSLFIRLGGLASDNDFLAAVADYIRNWEHAFGFLEKPRWENSHRNYCAQSCRDGSNKLETWAVLEGTAFPANSTWLVTCSLPIFFLLKDWQG